jgi:hypothetical protein
MPTTTILGLTPETWLALATFFAVLLGPILALWVQRRIDHRREQHNRKLFLFRELMATRSVRLSGRHVEALNLIDLEFTPTKSADRKVLDAWKLYLDSLGHTPTEASLQPAYFEKRNEHFENLLFEIGQYLGFSFDKVSIRRNAYTPVAHGQLEDDQRLIRQGVVEVLTGKRALSTISWVMPGKEHLRIETVERHDGPREPQAEPPKRTQPLVVDDPTTRQS